jgi:hypothetical protein
MKERAAEEVERKRANSNFKKGKAPRKAPVAGHGYND